MGLRFLEFFLRLTSLQSRAPRSLLSASNVEQSKQVVAGEQACPLWHDSVASASKRTFVVSNIFKSSFAAKGYFVSLKKKKEAPKYLLFKKIRKRCGGPKAIKLENS